MEKNGYSGNHTILIVVLVVLFLVSLVILNYPEYALGTELWQMAVNSLLLSVPLGMLYYAIGLMIVAWQQKQQHGQVSSRVASSLYWTPRAASVLITIFVALFSLDVFGSGASIWQEILAFLVHSIPAIVMGVVVVLAWRQPLIGFVMFLILAVAFFFMTSLGSDSFVQVLGSLLAFSGPMAAIALLYWFNWKWQVHRNSPSPLPAP